MIRSCRHRRGPCPAWIGVIAILAVSVTLAVNSAGAGVMIVKSGDLPQYSSPATAFRQASQHESVEIVLGEDTPDKAIALLKAAAEENNTLAVFALGSRAALAARKALPNTPVVFAMALGWSRDSSSGHPTTGVSVEVPAAELFTRFKLIMPRLQRVGVITGPSDGGTVAQARKAASLVGVEIVHETVKHSDEVAGAYRRIRSRVDALWMVPDPVVVTRENFDYLALRCRNDEVAFFAFSENFVKAGALLSVAPSYSTMGSQAAVLVEQMLSDPGEVPLVQAPLGATLVVNASTALALGLDLDATTIHMADRVIDPSRREF